MPKIHDIDFMNPVQFNSITSSHLGKVENYRPLIYDLIDFEQSTLNNLFFEMILQCLSFNPLKRPSSNDLLRHLKKIEEVWENKSQFTSIQSTVSKQNSYQDFRVNEERDRHLLKNDYLEQIRTRSRITKYNLTDFKEEMSPDLVNNNFKNNYFKTAIQMNAKQMNVRAVSSEPTQFSSNHSDSLKKKTIEIPKAIGNNKSKLDDRLKELLNPNQKMKDEFDDFNSSIRS